jgi:hypothetical protein
MRIDRPPVALLLLSLLTALAGHVSPAQGVPFSYSEGVSGDLKADLPAAAVFPFDIGTNTITGSNSVAIGISDDRDSFAFSIPAGTQLTQVTLAFSLVSNPAVLTSATESERLNNGPVGLGNIAALDVNFLAGSPINAYTANLPLGPGTYSIQDFVHGCFPANPNCTWTDSYTWSFVVTARGIPLPGSLLLVLVGFGGLVCWRWSH